MLTVILFLVAAYSVVMWKCTRLAMYGLLEYFVDEKGYEPPTDAQTRACLQKYLKRRFPWYSGQN